MRTMNNSSKKGYIILAVCITVIAAAIISIPNAYMSTIPTATSVSVKKLTHKNTIDISGSIIKDAATGQLWIQTFVSEKDISEVKTGQFAEITGDAFPDCIYTGKVMTIADTASKIQVGNSMKTMVQVDIEITDADSRLKPGYTANAILNTSEPKEMTVIPYDVINQDEIGEFVYVLENGTAEKRYISTGEELSQGVEVIGGISDTDTIISVNETIEEGNAVILDDN